MKNRNGFTLVELLIVIVILGIIVTIAVSSIAGITNMINQNMLEKKAEIIEEAATLLGQDIKGSIMASNLTYNGSPCRNFIVSDLVPTYLDKDNDNTCLNSESTSEIGCIVNPADSNKYMDQMKVIIYYKNKRIHAKVDINNELSCS